jgi:chromate transporter
MLPILERELVSKRGWTTQEELLDFFSLGQSVPGVIAVNTAIFVGYKQRGVFGGAAAAVGVVLPSLVIITLLAGGLEHFTEMPVVQKALTGINAAVAALLCRATWTFAKNSFLKKGTRLVGGAVAAAAFALVYVAHCSPIFIILGGALVGVIWKRPREDARYGGRGTR